VEIGISLGCIEQKRTTVLSGKCSLYLLHKVLLQIVSAVSSESVGLHDLVQGDAEERVDSWEKGNYILVVKIVWMRFLLKISGWYPIILFISWCDDLQVIFNHKTLLHRWVSYNLQCLVLTPCL